MQTYSIIAFVFSELQVLISPCGALIRLAFNAQSSYLIAACSEGVCVWPLPDSISEYNKKIRQALLLK